ncbi:MAG: multidrug efflux SMR transporter [Lentilactobacillus hilgardii]|uniref:DMT family transporter n=1 Tax=Lactobacillaceae TaxID=33958 RepID=UPI0010B3F9B3|nr:hypothetical protein OAL24_01448 [Oenococcus sicerae]
MAWLYLVLGGFFEILWATTMKLSNTFQNLYYDIVTIIGIGFSFLFLLLSIKHLPLSIAYPIWTGIGAIGSILVGMLIFKEHLSLQTCLFIVLLVTGLIGIRITHGS